MFFYLFYNSSFSFIVERRLFSTILYGSILYILTHAVLNYCDVSILNIINNYYWTIFSLDIISFTYAIYQSMNDENFGNDSTSSNSNFNVSFNLLKNKINTLLDRKNDLTITHIPISSNPSSPSNSSNSSQQNQLQQTKAYNNKQQQQQQQQNYDNHNHNQESQEDNQYQDSLQIPNSYNNQNVTILSSSSNKLSTPISQLQNKNNKTNKPTNTLKISNTSKASLSTSTPISIIRNSIDIEDPFIIDNNDNYDYKNSNNGNSVNSNNESIAGSDVGSIMDLEDFESSL